MKRRKYLYIIYCVIAVIAIAVVLIFTKLNTSNKPAKINSNQENISSSTDENDNIDKIDYVKSISLNCPRDFTVGLGCNIILKEGFVTVTPSELRDRIQIEIMSGSKLNPEGISITNNKISCESIGDFSIVFKARRSQSTYTSDTIRLHVVPIDENTHFEQNNARLFINQEELISSSITVSDTFLNPRVESLDNSKLEVKNDELIPKIEGLTSVYLRSENEYFSYQYTLHFRIYAEPKYSIEIIGLDSDELVVTDSLVMINYAIKDTNNNIDTDQFVTLNISDDSIAEILDNSPPFIYLTFKQKGSIRLTITSSINSEITRTIHIIYE